MFGRWDWSKYLSKVIWRAQKSVDDLYRIQCNVTESKMGNEKNIEEEILVKRNDQWWSGNGPSNLDTKCFDKHNIGSVLDVLEK